jgi:hypothetical protein
VDNNSRMNKDQPRTCRQVGLALIAAMQAVTSTAFAQGFDIAAGPSATSSERFASAVFASVFGDRQDDNSIHFEPIATLGWIGARHTQRENLHHEVFLAGGGMRIVAANHHWFVSEQLAATGTRTDALSSRFEFMTSGGWEDGHCVVMLQHISNAHLLGGGKNLGETMLLAGLRF